MLQFSSPEILKYMLSYITIKKIVIKIISTGPHLRLIILRNIIVNVRKRQLSWLFLGDIEDLHNCIK